MTRGREYRRFQCRRAFVSPFFLCVAPTLLVPLPAAAQSSAEIARPATLPPPSALGAPPAPEHVLPELPKFLDDKRLRAIEGVALPRIEAEEQRRAEKLKRKAIEADVKRKAEELRRSIDAAAQPAADPGGTIIDIIRPTQAVAAPLPSATSASPPQPIRASAATSLPLPRAAVPAAGPCADDARKGTATLTALPGGRVRLDLAEPCRAGETVVVRYAPYVFIRPLDENGRLSFVLDLFQGAEPPVAIEYRDGEKRPLDLPPTDLDEVSKVAIIWGKPVNLDLHVFEYAATHGSAGHVWAKSPANPETTRDESRQGARARGFLSFTSDGTEPGHQVEVYTLWLRPGQGSGIISTALDYETRGTSASGETCGTGALSQIAFETIAIAPGRPPLRERGQIGAADCGASLVEKARYLDDVIVDLPLGPS